MPSEITNYLKYANLQIAAESFFALGDSAIPGAVSNTMTVGSLTLGNNRSSKFTETQAQAFLQEGWSVVEHISNTSTGFSGTLFRNSQTGELVLSFRSTEFADDAARDNQATNVMEIKAEGWAFGQISDMRTWVDSLYATGKINAPLTVTGYSLGGHLATAFNLLYPSTAAATYTFNGAGVGTVAQGMSVAQAMNVFREHRVLGSNADLFSDSDVRSRYESLTSEFREGASITLTQVDAALDELDLLVLGEQLGGKIEALKLYDAMQRIRSVVYEAERVNAGINSGTGSAGAVPVNTSAIAAVALDYQLAVYRAGEHTAGYRTDPVSGGIDAYAGRNPAPGGAIANFYDLYGAAPPSAVANSQLHYGTPVPVFVEDQPLLRGGVIADVGSTSWKAGEIKLLVENFGLNDFGDTHSLVLIVDSLSVQHALAQLDPTLLTATVSDIFAAATNDRASWLPGTQGRTDGNTLESVVNAMADMLGLNWTGSARLRGSLDGNTWANIEDTGLLDGRATFHARLNDVVGSDEFQALIGNTTVTPAAGFANLGAQSKTDFGAFLALYTLSPVVISTSDANALAALQTVHGSLVVDWQADQNARLYGDTDYAYSYSDQWYEDRAALLRAVLVRNQQDNNTGQVFDAQAPVGQVTFFDFTDPTTGQSTVLSTRNSGESGLGDRHILFGGDQGETLQGFNNALGDRLYGGGGNDTLRGRGGNDHLEGGTGNDVLEGGSGNDNLLGGTGVDQLHGEAGDDVLRGGEGQDVYHIDGSAGNDTIIDTDGGLVMYQGQQLSGGRETSPGAREWKDDHATYRLITEGTQEHLLISVGAGTVTIRDWTPGHFGIQLPGYVAPTPVEPQTTFVGDLAPVDHNSSAAGVQVAYDQFGNVIVNPDRPELDRADTLYDSVGHDLLEGKGGNDLLNAIRGGDDTLLGGEGQDRLFAQAGNDKVFADDELSDAQVVADHALATEDIIGIAERGDLLSGGVGNDWQAGGRRADLLFGGDGRDTLWGGAGDDAIYGDSQAHDAQSDWALTRETTFVSETEVTEYQVTTTGVSYVAPSQTSSNDVLNGGAGNDWIFGEEGQDQINGGSGDDVVFAGGDSDWVVGGTGSDVIAGDYGVRTEEDFGNDLLDGGAGNDTMWGDAGHDVLFGGDGNDELTGDGRYIAVADQGDDFLDGGAGNDTMYGYAGNDTLLGGVGDDMLQGDAAQSRLAGEHHGDDSLDGGAGNDSLYGFGGNDTLDGGEDDDYLNGDAREENLGGAHHGSDSLSGGSGNDSLFGSGESDTLIGGEGDDYLNGDDEIASLAAQFHASDLLDGGEGNDTLIGGGGDDTLNGGSGNDYLLGDSSNAQDSSLNGNDILNGGDGDDTLMGGAGNDTLIGGAGTDFLAGGAGDDTYVFSAGDSALNALQQSEVVDDSEGRNVFDFGGVDRSALSVQGFNGSDLFIGFGGTSGVAVLGGMTNAQNRYALDSGSVLNHQQLVGRFAATSMVATGVGGQRAILGGRQADTLTADQAGDVISGGRGNDQLIGSGSGSHVYHFHIGDGADTLIDTSAKVDALGNPTHNRLVFGEGISLVNMRLSGYQGALRIRIGEGSADSITFTGFGAAGSLPSPIDEIEFADGTVLSMAQMLALGFDGDGSAEDIEGSTGDDLMQGNGGADTLRGASGDDTLIGGAGDDVLIGGEGSDTYRYGLGDGQDRIEGTVSGPAVDTVVFGPGITADAIRVSHDNGELFLQVGGSAANGIRISGFDANQADMAGMVASYSFADGSTLSHAALVQRGFEFNGTIGVDLQNGTNLDDRFNASEGDDRLRGGSGSDDYYWGLSAGNDRIEDTATVAQGLDRLVLDAGIAVADLRVSRVGDDLAVWVAGQATQMQVANHFAGQGLEQIVFADATVWNGAHIASLTTGTLLEGTAGNDLLTGGDFDDTLVGGLGNDTLQGGAGSDDYHWGPGTGDDRIEDSTAQGADRLVLDPAVNAADLRLMRVGDDLQVRVNGQPGVLVVAQQFAGLGAEQFVLGSGAVWDRSQIEASAGISLTSGNDVYSGSSSNNYVAGLEGNDTLRGNGGDDTLDGGAGNDSITGGTGNDWLIDGEVMQGGSGNDTYEFTAWPTGRVYIEEDTTAGADRLKLLVASTDVRLGRLNWSVDWANAEDLLLLHVNDYNESRVIVVRRHFMYGNQFYRLEEVEFSDGVVWTHQDLYEMSVNAHSGEYRGHEFADAIVMDGVRTSASGNGGNDTITGSTIAEGISGGLGNDLLFGGGGNDGIHGGDDNDTLSGGIGNDTLNGGNGNDVFRIARGDGSDFLSESSGLDTVELEGGVLASDVQLFRDLNDLVISVDQGQTQVRVRDQFSGANYTVETIRFSDGSIWGSAEIAAQLIPSTPNTMVGTAGDDLFVVDHIQDQVSEAAHQGTDTVQSAISYTLGANIENLSLTGVIDLKGTGNALSNRIVGNAGANTLDGGTSGADTLQGGQGNDTYILSSTDNMVIEAEGEGIDTVFVRGQRYGLNGHALSAHVENLITLSTDRFYISRGAFIGNDLDNTISLLEWYPYSTIDGGAGADTMISDAESTTFYVDNMNDRIVASSSGHTVVSSVSRDMAGLNRSTLRLTGSDTQGLGTAGVDRLESTGWNNTLVGGADDDTYVVQWSSTRQAYSAQIVETEQGGTADGLIVSGDARTYHAADFANIERIQLDERASESNISGDSRANHLTGNRFANLLDGGDGDDYIVAGGTGSTANWRASDTVLGGDGNDTLVGSINSDLYGGAGDDLLDGSSGNYMDGGAGNDELRVSRGNLAPASIRFGTGSGHDRVFLGIYNNPMSSYFSHTAVVRFSPEVQTSDLKVLRNGRELILEISAADRLSFTDFFNDATGMNHRYGLTGVEFSNGSLLNFDDLMQRLAAGNSNEATAEDDTYLGSSLADTFDGQAGQDKAWGDLGDDVLSGGEGNDSLYGGGGADYLSGGAGDDRLDGAAGGDQLIGGAGDDVLDGGAGDDLLIGGAGDDTILYKDGMDVIRFAIGDGHDTILKPSGYYADGTQIAIEFAPGILPSDVILTAEFGWEGDFVLSLPGGADSIRLERFFDDDLQVAVSFADGTFWSAQELAMTARTLSGDEAANYLEGDWQSDRILGLAGNDTLLAYDGDDTLDGGEGADSMEGGWGDDTYHVDHTSDLVVEQSDQGHDRVISSVTHTLRSNFEDLELIGTANLNGTGNAVANRIVGNAGNNSLSGATGADTLEGRMGDDIYVVDNVADVVVELEGQGTDLVLSSVSYTLSANVENLTMTGSSSVSGTGNGLSNHIVGNSGANTLTGGLGDDTIDGGAGPDSMLGGAGNDSYAVEQTSDVIAELADEGIDTVNSSVTWTLGNHLENLLLTGSSGIHATGNSLDNYFTGNSGNNSLIGNAGSDTLDGGAGTDTLLGGSGNDTLLGGLGDDLVDGGAGRDLLQGGEGNDRYWLRVGEDAGVISEIQDTQGNNVILLEGAELSNMALTAQGEQWLLRYSASDTVLLDGQFLVEIDGQTRSLQELATAITQATGTPPPSPEEPPATPVIEGTSGADSLVGDAQDDVLLGGAGNDTLNGGLGADTLRGGSGNDVFTVDNEGDVVIELAAEGTDRVNSSISYTLGDYVENLTLTGSAAINGMGNGLNNAITGNGAANILEGGGGNDAINGGAGTDTMRGGVGNDTYTVDNAGDVAVELAGEGTDRVNSSISYILGSNVENLTLTGSAAINGTGNGLNNAITGNSAANILEGGEGNDAINGGAGADTMRGGVGNDTYTVENAGDAVVELAWEGTDRVNSSISYTLGGYVENLTLTGSAAINGTGNALNNVINGNAAANMLSGGAGNDTFSGDAGADTLIGGAGDDRLVGGSGNDTYSLGRGHGVDTIVENDATTGNTDVARFEADVSADQLWFSRSGNNLNVSIIGTSDRFVVSNWYLGSQHYVEQFQTADGQTLLDSQVHNLVQAMAAFSPPPMGQTTLTTAQQTELAPVIAANWN